MINWDNINYDLGKATKDFAYLSVESKGIVPIKPFDEFLSLREELIAIRDEVFDELGLDNVNKLGYTFDLAFGIKIYKLLNSEIGFNNRVAVNDDVWRYLSIKVIPDIVHARWEFNDSHFYKDTRRIWLKTIWWYIHLSWQGNEEDTLKILKNNSTDTIMQLVDRSGIGYNIELYREIMKEYQNYNDRKLFRRLLILNVARILTMSPDLVEGGIERYVKDLYESVK
ncbi:hypothetical protein BUY92_10160 [Staphylococcus equorum]|nr:DUF6339 family protein [Staphylococcus equorum]MEB7852929.1 DUF6339 family protein [Staphylococcus equorum]PTE24465.1 hypothetical protein BUY92_10160 [Staphylococcus equorum]PTE31154.1 hypothetical protein BUY83_03505 [Staphylococcus equorum]QQB59557.1 hypothetical protein I6I25_12280 [Staphylococcus equorum]RIL95387.1 hypothetical protein BUY80_12745 [Staphylococcus equorum]